MTIGSKISVVYPSMVLTGNNGIEYQDTFWEDLTVPATVVKLGGVNDPNFVKLADDGSGSTGTFTYAFDKASEEEIFFNVQIPHAKKYDTDIKAHVHWMPADGTAGNVVWGLEYQWVNINGAFSATGNTLIEATVAADETALKHQIDGIGTITGTNFTLSSMLACRLYRKAADAADTYDNDVYFLEFDFHVEYDRPGSRDEFVK
jgi:hypothetical protein